MNSKTRKQVAAQLLKLAERLSSARHADGLSDALRDRSPASHYQALFNRLNTTISMVEKIVDLCPDEDLVVSLEEAVDALITVQAKIEDKIGSLKK